MTEVTDGSDAQCLCPVAAAGVLVRVCQMSGCSEQVEGLVTSRAVGPFRWGSGDDSVPAMSVMRTERQPVVENLQGGLPQIIQGGMGVGVSSWQLARAVSRASGLGVVSGTALDLVLARRLQDGDEGGSMRRGLAVFPVPAMAQRVLDRYFQPQGRTTNGVTTRPYRPAPKLTLRQSIEQQELAVVANFVEVWLAKEGHDGVVGVNYLEKVQMATPSAALGAVLAGVDYELMGDGLPRQIPRLHDDLAA
ncbi:MAG: hypothetical protein QOD39_4312, partial [Mycobacterium sp.]|nr:hypothetical protein [Mycobacterium sp.]